MRIPSERMLNRDLSEQTGREVIQFEVIEVEPKATVELSFVSVADDIRWPQGVWVGTEGVLEVAGERRGQFTFWAATAPPVVRVTVEETDGLLRLYNVWDRRGIGDGLAYQSLGRTSGMLRSDLPDGSIEYRCADSGQNPDFDRVVFRVRIT